MFLNLFTFPNENTQKFKLNLKQNGEKEEMEKIGFQKAHKQQIRH